MLGGLNVTVRLRQISNSNYDLNLGLQIEATFSRDPVQSRSTFLLTFADGASYIGYRLDLNYVGGKRGF